MTTQMATAASPSKEDGDGGGDGVLRLVQHSHEFLRSPITGLMALFRDLVAVSPGHLANAMTHVAQRVQAVYANAHNKANIRDEDAVKCMDELDRAFSSVLEHVKVKSLSEEGASFLRKVLSVRDLSVMSPLAKHLPMHGMRDPVEGSATAEMSIHRSTYSLARIAAELIQLMNTRRRGLYEESPTEWFDYDLALHMGNTALVRACTNAARRHGSHQAFDLVLSTKEMVEAVKDKKAVSELDLKRLYAGARVDRLLAHLIRHALVALRRFKARTERAPIVAKASMMKVNSKQRVGVYSSKAVAEHLEIIRSCLERLKGDAVSAPDAALKSLAPDSDEVHKARARLVAMRDDIEKRSVSNRMDPQWYTGNGGSTEANTTTTAAAAAGAGAGADASAGAGAANNGEGRLIWGTSKSDDIWKPPAASDIKAIAQISAAAPKANDWSILDTVVEQTGTPWCDFVTLARVSAHMNRGGASADASPYQFVDDVERYMFNTTAHTARMRLSKVFREDFCQLLAGERNTINTHLKRRIQDELQSAKVQNANASASAAPDKLAFVPTHVKFVKTQLAYHATMSRTGISSALVQQIHALETERDSRKPSLSWPISKLRAAGYEALCTLLCAVRHGPMTPLSRQVQSHRDAPKLDVKKQMRLMEDIDTSLRQCVFYACVVDRCVVFLSHVLDKLSLSTEQRRVVADGFVGVWIKRLQLATNTQSSWGGLPSEKVKALTEMDLSLFVIPVHMICQSGIEPKAIPDDVRADALAFLVHASRVGFVDRLTAARTTVSESVCVQAVIWERLHAINVLRAKSIIASTLVVGEEKQKQQWSSQQIADHIRDETEVAQAIVSLAVVSLCAPPANDGVYDAKSVKDASTAALKHMKATGISPKIVPAVDSVSTADVRNEVQKIAQRYDPSKRRGGVLARGIRGLLVSAFIDAVHGLSHTVSDLNVIETSRLAECMSIFNVTSAALLLDNAKLAKWTADISGQLVARSSSQAAAKPPQPAAYARTRALSAWQASARDMLFAGHVHEFGRAFEPTLEPRKIKILADVADAHSDFFESVSPTTLDKLEGEIWDAWLKFHSVREVVRPITTPAPPSKKASAAPAPAPPAAAAAAAAAAASS